MLEERISDVGAIMEQLYQGKLPVEEIAAEYSRDDLCASLEASMQRVEMIVGAMSPAQLAYRMAGAPTGPDESGDEAHFDTSQIATHLASGLAFHWWGMTRALGDERPAFPKPPEGAPTTGKYRTGMGAGGWSGAGAAELVALLRNVTERFLAYARALPEGYEKGGVARYGIFGTLTAHGWLFLAAAHPAMHLLQIRELQSQPDYPPA